MTEILSIGHSSLVYEEFVGLIRAAQVTAIADVRTSPFSRNFPHFSQMALKHALAEDDIAYVFLGKELGGRPVDRDFYTCGVADYEKMAASASFQRGLDRVVQGARKYRIALMCSERDPLDCHRCLLVGRALKQRGHSVAHIVAPHQTTTQEEIESRLLKMAGKDEADMFISSEDRLNDAYRTRSRRVAFEDAQLISPDVLTV